jgi:signal transduction histidine kinase
LHLVLLAVAAVYGLLALTVARQHGIGTTYADNSGWAAALDLAAGWGLVLAGLLVWHLRPRTPTGPLTVAAGFAWFAPDWVGWEGGPELVRSLGMLVAGLWLALLVHAVLAFPSRLSSRAARLLVVAVYVEIVLVDVGRALFRDPLWDLGCWSNCTVNSFLVHRDPGVARALGWIDLRFAVALAALFLTLSLWRLAASTPPARRMLAPVLAAGVAVTSLHAALVVARLRTPVEDPLDPTFAALFVGQCLAVASVVLALCWTLARSGRARRAVERLALDLAELPRPGALEAALARATGDPSLRIAYRLRQTDRYVDGQGRTVPRPSPSPEQAVTPIVRDGRPLALLEHDPAVLHDAFQHQIGSAARLALDNERLQAETLAQLFELRKSRERIVQAGDAARRQLERDLHDGAQQRLVALSFALRLALAELGADPDPRVAEPLADADRALAEALAAVREVANGLFPAALTSSGLAYAVEELAELSTIRIDVEALPDRRLPAAVEAAAYGVIREAVENAAVHAETQRVAISAYCRSDAVVVEASDDGVGGADPALGIGLREVADRVGALGGWLRVQSPMGGGTRIEAEIPCA